MKSINGRISEARATAQEMNILFMGRSKATPAEIALATALSNKRIAWQQRTELQAAISEVWEFRLPNQNRN